MSKLPSSVDNQSDAVRIFSNSQLFLSRRSNFEALRVVSILLIIAGHMWMEHDWGNSMWSTFAVVGVRPFTAVGVNCFVLISGWFGIKLNWRKLWSLNIMTTSWIVVLGIIAIAIGLHEVDVRKDVLMLMPVLTKRYWFITVYFALCIISPLLNRLVGSLSQNEFRYGLLSLILLFICVPTLGYLFNFPSITNDSGYGLGNFIMLYLLGRYLKLHYKSNINKWIDLIGYILCMGFCGLFQFVYSLILGFEFTSFISYDTVFVFFGSILLFMFFAKCDFINRTVNWIASFCLATYVIHIHPWMFPWVYQDLLYGNNLNGWSYGAFILIIPFVTLLICVSMESMRRCAMRLVYGLFNIGQSKLSKS